MRQGPANAGGREHRRLDPSRDVAIFGAVLSGLTEVGYERLSMDEIAARAHVGKATIYRRWSSKAEVVAAAAVWWRQQNKGVMVAPDTGTFRGDVEAALGAVPAVIALDPDLTRLFMELAAAASRDAALASALDEQVLAVPREVMATILERAVARGEIPPQRDLSLVGDVAMGLNMLRLATGKPIDQAFARRVSETVILPLATAPAADASQPE